MTAEQSFFIRILSDYINQRQTDYSADLDWTEIFRLSRSHMVDGIVFRQCKDYLVEKDKYAYRQAYDRTLYHYTNLEYEYLKIREMLDSKKLFFFPVKGFFISAYYSIPELRLMSDCDIIIHHSDMGRVQSLMCDQGYNGIDNIQAHSWECRKKSFTIEFHDHLVSEDEHVTDVQRHFFNEFDPYVSNHELECSFHFMYLLMHLRKHFMNSGVGIRQFMDIAVMIRNCPDLDWKWIEKKLLEIQLMPFAKACFFLVKRWFGISTPIGPSDIDEDFFEKVTGKILGNGIFGKDDPENAGNYEKNVLIKAKGTMWTRRTSLFFKMLFPSCQFMKSYPGCGFLIERPILLPAAWGKRLWMLISEKGHRKLKRILHNSFVSLKMIEKQDDLLKKMGLP